MEDIRDILRIPNREVVSVTKVLTGVDLKKTPAEEKAPAKRGRKPKAEKAAEPAEKPARKPRAKKADKAEK